MTQKIKLPQSIEKTLYITIGVGRYNFNEIMISEWDSSPYASEGSEKVLLKEQAITLDLSDAELTETKIKQDLVDQLKEQLKKIRAESHQKEKAIQDRIDSLLTIEYTPEPTDKRHPRVIQLVANLRYKNIKKGKCLC